MPKDRGSEYVPLADAYAAYGRRPVDRLREDGTLTEATWEGDPAIYLLRSELEEHFGKPKLTRRTGEQVG